MLKEFPSRVDIESRSHHGMLTIETGSLYTMIPDYAFPQTDIGDCNILVCMPVYINRHRENNFVQFYIVAYEYHNLIPVKYEDKNLLFRFKDEDRGEEYDMRISKSELIDYLMSMSRRGDNVAYLENEQRVTLFDFYLPASLEELVNVEIYPLCHRVIDMRTWPRRAVEAWLEILRLESDQYMTAMAMDQKYKLISYAQEMRVHKASEVNEIARKKIYASRMDYYAQMREQKKGSDKAFAPSPFLRHVIKAKPLRPLIKNFQQRAFINDAGDFFDKMVTRKISLNQTYIDIIPDYGARKISLTLSRVPYAKADAGFLTHLQFQAVLDIFDHDRHICHGEADLVTEFITGQGEALFQEDDIAMFVLNEHIVFHIKNFAPRGACIIDIDQATNAVYELKKRKDKKENLWRAYKRDPDKLDFDSLYLNRTPEEQKKTESKADWRTFAEEMHGSNATEWITFDIEKTAYGEQVLEEKPEEVKDTPKNKKKDAE